LYTPPAAFVSVAVVACTCCPACRLIGPANIAAAIPRIASLRVVFILSSDF
jgi:hypothetical protein